MRKTYRGKLQTLTNEGMHIKANLPEKICVVWENSAVGHCGREKPIMRSEYKHSSHLQYQGLCMKGGLL